MFGTVLPMAQVAAHEESSMFRNFLLVLGALLILLGRYAHSSD